MKSFVAPPIEDARVIRVGITTPATTLDVYLRDGRILRVPIDWFPRLREATTAQLLQCQIIGDGVGLHWPALDEDLSIAHMLGQGPS